MRRHSPTTRGRRAGDGANRRLDNRTLWEQVRDRLREDILAGELPPGHACCREVALARSFGVSRGPVREALGRLATEGLVTITPRRGAIVTELAARGVHRRLPGARGARDARDPAGGAAAGDADIARLRELHEEMVEHARRDEVNAFFDTNASFHEALRRASGNQKLHEMYRLLIGQMARYLARSLALRGNLEKSVAEHAAILEAVEAATPNARRSLLADHIEVPQRVEEETGERRRGRCRETT